MGNCQLKESIFKAVQSGEVEELKSLLAKLGDGDVSFIQSPENNTPLHIACICGHDEITRILLQHPGCEKEAKDADGRTPMYVAAMGGHTAIVKMLAEAGAVIDSKSHTGLTPFFVSCWRNHREIAQYLLERGADLLVRDEQGRTAWMIAREWNHLALAGEIEQLARLPPHEWNEEKEKAFQATRPISEEEKREQVEATSQVVLQMPISSSTVQADGANPTASPTPVEKEIVAQQAPHIHP